MPAKTAGRVMRTAEAFTELATAGPKVPKSPFNVRIGRDRRVAWAKADLDRLKRARAAAEGSTVNDVVLSIAAGALRRYMERRGDDGARTTWSPWSRSASGRRARSSATASRRSW